MPFTAEGIVAVLGGVVYPAEVEWGMNANPVVTKEQIETYQADGVLCLRGVISRCWLEVLWRAAEEAMKLPPMDAYQAYFRRIHLRRVIPGFDQFMRQSVLPEMASVLMSSSKVNFLYDQLFVKEPHMVDRTVWHNDQPTWPIRGWQVMSFSVALDHTDKRVGALEFIRGSHSWNAWYQPPYGDSQGRALKNPTPSPGFLPVPDFEAQRDQHEILCWDLEPGDVIAFHALAVHGGTANVSGDRVRRAYTLRSAGEDAYYQDVSHDPTSNERMINPELKTGDPLDSEMYPLVYPM